MATTTAGKQDSDPLASDYETVRKDLTKLQAQLGALVNHLRPVPGHSIDSISRQARMQIEERPLTVLGITFLAGFVIHMMLGRR